MPKQFRCSDLYEAAFYEVCDPELRIVGVELAKLAPNATTRSTDTIRGGQRLVFIFDDTPRIRILAEVWQNNRATVNAIAYARAIQVLRDLFCP